MDPTVRLAQSQDLATRIAVLFGKRRSIACDGERLLALLRRLREDERVRAVDPSPERLRIVESIGATIGAAPRAWSRGTPSRGRPRGRTRTAAKKGT